MTVMLMVDIGLFLCCGSAVEGWSQEEGLQRLPVGDMDEESQRCMECHNGSAGPAIALRPVDAPVEFEGLGQMCTVNHPMGMDYQGSTVKYPDEFRSAAAVAPGISLIDGKVGCLSCHIKRSLRNSLVTRRDLMLPESPGQCTDDSAVTAMLFGLNVCLGCHVR